MSKKRKGKHSYQELTDVKVRQLKTPGLYGDGNALYLRVDGNGSKRWVVRTVINGKRCDVGIGGLAYTPLKDAREKAIEIRKAARNGGDPLGERRADREVRRRKAEEESRPTFEAAAREYHAGKPFKNAKHRKQWLKVLEDYAFPVFGKKRVDLVDSGDVLEALTPVWSKLPETARRTKQRTRSVLDFAKAKQWRSGDNPTEALGKVLPAHKRKVRHHRALPWSKLPEFIAELRTADAAESVKVAFELLILCVARTSEVLRAEWSEFDLDAKAWTIPAARMKAEEEHRIPLTARCLELLQAARELGGGSKFVFPGRSRGHLSDMAFNMCLRRMERTDCTPHGFRSTFRDWAVEKTRVQREVVEACLSHSPAEDKTEAAYLRSDLFRKRRDLMQRWAAFATAA